jgi:hypothetical protein
LGLITCFKLAKEVASGLSFSLKLSIGSRGTASIVLGRSKVLLLQLISLIYPKTKGLIKKLLKNIFLNVKTIEWGKRIALAGGQSAWIRLRVSSIKAVSQLVWLGCIPFALLIW